MLDGKHNHLDDDPAEIAARWIDEGGSARLRDECSKLDASARRRLADHLFMHSLLAQSQHSEREAIDRGIAAAFESIDADHDVFSPESLSPVHAESTQRRSWLVSAFSVVAGLVAVFVLWLATEATAPSARAAVAQAIRQADLPLDRHYRITVEFAAIGPLTADLYLQGPDKLALRATGPLNLWIWLGGDSNRCWIVPPAGPVVTARDFDKLRQRLGETADLPMSLLRLSHLLRAIERDYDLSYVGKEERARLAGGTWQHIRAEKRPGFRPLLPQRVDFWAEPGTGVIGQLALDWVGQVENLAVKRIDFQLVDQEPRAADWYDPSSHHEADRPRLEL